MKESVYYQIDKERITDDRDEAKVALKYRKAVVKVVRIQYDTGPTRVIVTTLSTITKVKDL